jgi:hypothetical protein
MARWEAVLDFDRNGSSSESERLGEAPLVDAVHNKLKKIFNSRAASFVIFVVIIYNTRFQSFPATMIRPVHQMLFSTRSL